jgi:hypothetical protein
MALPPTFGRKDIQSSRPAVGGSDAADGLATSPVTQAGWDLRNLPKWGTVNAISPRSEL